MPCPAILLTFDALHEAAVLLDASGNVLHGNRAAEQLFGWNVKPSTAAAAAAATAASASSTHVVSSMLSLPPAPADHMGHAATYSVPTANGADQARKRSSSVVSSTSVSSGTAGTGTAVGSTSNTGSSTGLPRSSPPISGGQPNLTFNPDTQQASWADTLASLPDGKICQRDGVGYRLEPATTAGSSGDHRQPTRISFPVSVNLLKMSDGAYAAPASRPDAEQAPELPDVDGGDPYVCVFVKELPHAADEWSRQHRAMSANYDDTEVAMEAMTLSNNVGAGGGGGGGGGRGPNPAAVGEAGGPGVSAGPVGGDRALLDPIDLEQKTMLTASAIIEASIDPMFCINERGIIMMVNEAAIRSFGYTRKEFISANIQMIVGGGHAKNHDQYIARYLKTGERRVMGKKRDLMARHKSGEEFPIELGLTEILHRGGKVTFTGVVRDLSDQKHDKVELRLKHSLTLSIIEAACDAMFYINERGIIQMVNEAAVKQFGWSRSEFLGSNISMICGGGRAPNHDNYIKRYLRTGEKRVMGKKRELRARRRDGSEFPIELGLTEVQVRKGEERSFCGFIRDLSKEKEQQKDVMRKQRLMAGILDATFDAMFAINEKGIIQMVNNSAEEQFGWTRDELVGNNISKIVGGGHAERHDGYLARFLRTGEKRVMGKKRELPARRKDGSEFWIELGLTEVRTEKGEERLFTGFLRDLSAIKRRQRLTAGILESAFDPVFAINSKGTITMANDAATKQFGWTKEQFLNQDIAMIVGGGHAVNHSEYIKRYLRTGEKRVMGIRRELSARRADGTEFPIELGLTELQCSELPGQEEREFVGFVRDISLQKKQEAELKEKQAFTEGLIEASLDAMFAIDEQGRIKMVNDAAVKQFQWSRNEFLGQNIKMVMGPEHSGKHDRYIKRFLRTGEARILGQQRELEAMRRDGSFFPISLGVTEVSIPGNTDGSRMFAAYIHDLTQRHQVIEMEKAELLLLNMLPEDIALRLKADNGHIADHFPSVAILFADLVGFTKMSSKMKPTELVKMLNEVFSIFDALVDKYDLNKVKTIGDCYMVTSHPDEDTEVEEITHLCHFALDMIDALISYNIDHPGRNLNLRIGINVGPVVAGVVGKKRFLYDIWGEAVNLASRMESTGIPGKIHCTKAIVDLVGSDFEFESRGTVDVKSVGKIETFILTQRKRLVPARSAPVRRPRQRRSSLLAESLKTLKSSRKILEEKIEDLQNRISDSSVNTDDSDSSSSSDDRSNLT